VKKLIYINIINLIKFFKVKILNMNCFSCLTRSKFINESDTINYSNLLESENINLSIIQYTSIQPHSDSDSNSESLSDSEFEYFNNDTDIKNFIKNYLIKLNIIDDINSKNIYDLIISYFVNEIKIIKQDNFLYLPQINNLYNKIKKLFENFIKFFKNINPNLNINLDFIKNIYSNFKDILDNHLNYLLYYVNDSNLYDICFDKIKKLYNIIKLIELITTDNYTNFEKIHSKYKEQLIFVQNIFVFRQYIFNIKKNFNNEFNQYGCIFPMTFKKGIWLNKYSAPDDTSNKLSNFEFN